MSWFGVSITYAVCWWLVLFMVLPWGVRPEENPQIGNAVSAPARPRLRRKIIITSVLTLIPTAIFYVVITDAKAANVYSTGHAGSGCKPATLPNTAGDVPVDINVPIAPYYDASHQGSSSNNSNNTVASSQGSIGLGKGVITADGSLMVNGKRIGAADPTGCPPDPDAADDAAADGSHGK